MPRKLRSSLLGQPMLRGGSLAAAAPLAGHGHHLGRELARHVAKIDHLRLALAHGCRAAPIDQHLAIRVASLATTLTAAAAFTMQRQLGADTHGVRNNVGGLVIARQIAGWRQAQIHVVTDAATAAEHGPHHAAGATSHAGKSIQAHLVNRGRSDCRLGQGD